MGPKEDQVRALREARFERWRRSSEEPARVPDMMKRARIKVLSDKVAVVVKKRRGGRPKVLGEPWKAEGISRAQYYRNKGKPK
jgi:hypothetical protein